MTTALPRIESVAPAAPTGATVRHRLELTAVSLAYALLMAPALALAILSIVMLPTALALAGFLLALGVVPATQGLAGVHRRISGALLGEEIPAGYAPAAEFPGVYLTWVRDPARWRDVAFLWFSATGGFVMSLLPVALLVASVSNLVQAIIFGGWLWWLLALLGGPALVAWWLVTPALLRARALVERSILGHGRVDELERRVEEVEESRSETLDHSAAEIRRIERDLHDGAQARIAAVGMNVGLAEKLLASDPQAAADLLREARETTVSALEDLRSVVRTIHPPVLADRGLAGAVEGLALTLPVPVTLRLDVPPGLPAPVESAAYFAVAECLANTVKHAAAARAWVSLSHDGEALRVVVGDDGRGGADAKGSGLGGVARRLAAFDGTLAVRSPVGAGTVVTMEVPCRTG